jgi:hypothetical protein
MMPKPVGGRGMKAPYETTHLRVPIPIKSQIEAIIEEYREAVLTDINLLTSYQININTNPLTSLEDAKKFAKKHLRAKKKKEQMLANLLSDIYQTKVTEEDLTR